jgi:uncharacterized glyoxalase superfamily protein PhnB
MSLSRQPWGDEVDWLTDKFGIAGVVSSDRA